MTRLPDTTGSTPNHPQPSSSNHTVALRWGERASPQGGKSLQMAVAECVETKTVTTTTTTTTRTYPPMYTRQLDPLDPKEYPLANQQIPDDLRSVALQFRELDPSDQQSLLRQPSSGPCPESVIIKEEVMSRSPSDGVISRRSLRSNSQSQRPESAISTTATRKSVRRSSRNQPPSDRLLRSVTSSNRRASVDGDITWPSTPDGRESRAMSPHHSSFETAGSGEDAPIIPSPRVATPPITIADTSNELSAIMDASPRAHNLRPDVAVDHDASLPSPRLSPTLAAQMEVDTATDQLHLSHPEGSIEDELEAQLQLRKGYSGPNSDSLYSGDYNPLSMIETFDAMPTDMKTFMMYQFLRRCPRKTLRVIANAVNPSLQCDFLRLLPIELCYEILSYLNHVDLCRAAQVSKWWRHVIDSNETGWKDLFDRDGFRLAAGELKIAIQNGWGWQDPVGADGAEIDLSAQQRMSQPESELLQSSSTTDTEHTSPPRVSKRKRVSGSMSLDRPRRRFNEPSLTPEKFVNHDTIIYKRKGTLTAANSAARAVPDPKIGLDSLRTLHLFKSLYRRHHMIRESWMNGKVKPQHIAFAAHPRHVITCLQFDDEKIITGSDDTQIHVYETATGRLLRKLEGHEGGVWALQYDGNTLVSGSTDRTVRVWNIVKGICTQVFHGHTSTVRCLQILMPTEVGRDPQGDPVMQPPKPLIITGSRDYNLRVWRLPEANEARWNGSGSSPVADLDCPYFIRTLTGHTHSVRAIAAHGDILVSGSYDNTVRVWKISSGESKWILEGHNQKVYSVVLDAERNRCISGSMDSMVKVWDLNTGTCLFTLEGHSHLVGLLDLREGRLVSAAADSTLRIWNPEDGACRTVLAAHTGAITCFQHDARKVISGSEKAVKMWDIQTGLCVKDLLTNLTAVWQVKFDGRRCVAAVQRDALTYVEILDFGAVRDGVPATQLGTRQVVNRSEVVQATGAAQAQPED